MSAADSACPQKETSGSDSRADGAMDPAPTPCTPSSQRQGHGVAHGLVLGVKSVFSVGMHAWMGQGGAVTECVFQNICLSLLCGSPATVPEMWE